MYSHSCFTIYLTVVALHGSGSLSKRSPEGNKLNYNSCGQLFQDDRIKENLCSSITGEPSPELIAPDKPLNRAELIRKRILFAICMMMVLVAGILGHFLIKYDDHIVNTNGLMLTNTTAIYNVTFSNVVTDTAI